MFYCYILKNDSEKFKNRSYVGSTNKPSRRIRQHNGEITGGAKSTKVCNVWKFCALVTGFPDKINMLQCEWAIKHQKNHGPGGRIKALCKTLKTEKWTKNSTVLNKDIKLKAWVLEEYKDNIIDLPDNVEVIYVNYIDPIDIENHV